MEILEYLEMSGDGMNQSSYITICICTSYFWRFAHDMISIRVGRSLKIEGGAFDWSCTTWNEEAEAQMQSGPAHFLSVHSDVVHHWLYRFHAPECKALILA